MRKSLRSQYNKLAAAEGFSASKNMAAAEGFISNHDDTMIKDCDEDLNALLILAGLFATVLTAFLAGSTGWLQQDYTQATAQLLVQISAQLAGGSQTGIAQMPMFEAATVDIGINILWFLSLVLSLASALFGMIVKRWLREYPAWQTEPLQEAICLRQVRYKAFLQWKVPLIVALLPGLLEVALVLFMAGIVAMLWTLNSLLAAIISTVSALFLIITFSAILIPAFFHRCPYRSPAGWACVLAWEYVCRFYYRLLWTAGLVSRTSLHDQLRKHRPQGDWKERDLYLNFADESGHGLGSPLHAETTKLVHLVDALVWTYERCQNDSLLDGLSYHISDAESSNNTPLRLHIPMYAACRKLNLGTEKLLDSLRSQYVQHNLADGRTRYTLCLSNTLDALHPWSTPNGNAYLQILGFFLLSELRRTTMTCRTSCSPSTVVAFIEALSFLYHVVRACPALTLKQSYVNFLVDLYRDSARDEDAELPSQLPSFRTMVVRILSKLGPIRLYGGHISVDLNQTHMGFKDYARLAIQVYQENSEYANEEGRHLFVTLADIAIQKCDSWYVSYYHQDDVQSLLQCMEEAARISLERDVPNCGHYDDMPWITSLSKAARTNAGLHTCIPLSLLRTLGTGLTLGLFTGEGLRVELRRLKARCTCRDTVSFSPGGVPAEDPFATGVSTPRTPGSTSQSAVQESYNSSSRTPLLSSPSSDSLARSPPEEIPYTSSPTSLSSALVKDYEE